MMLRTGSSGRRSKRRSRLVTRPTRAPASTTGTPEMLWARVSASTSRIEVSGPTVIGSRMTPASNFLAARTSAAWRSTPMFLWTMPMPPSWAMAIAMVDSVTESIAADTSGRLRVMSRASRDLSDTSLGRTLE